MRETFDEEQMIKRISTYLTVLGIIQLIGLNLGGILWLVWARGIDARKPSSRRWVIAIHSVYLACCAWGLFKYFFDPGKMGHLMVLGRKIDAAPSLILAFILLMVLVYGLPVVWLLSKGVRQEFIEPAHAADRAGA